MESVGIYEAKTHLAQLIDRVEKGERITITRRGVPVAVLQPVKKVEKKTVEEAIEEIIKSRKGRRLNGLTIRELVEEGRRW